MSTLCGGSALNQMGLCSFYLNTVFQTTDIPKYDQFNFGSLVTFYLPDLDADNSNIVGLSQTLFSPVQVPNRERAICDYIKHIDVFDEFFLVEALQVYERRIKDLTKLRALAESYGLADQLEYWLKEAREDCEV